MTVFIETYGCQMNQSESFSLRSLLEDEGHKIVDCSDDADVIIINTCVVRKHAEDKIWSRLGSIPKEKKVFVTGCMAEQEKEELKRRFSVVKGVFGPQHLLELPVYINKIEECVKTGESDYKFPPAAIEKDNPFKGSITISHGCSNFCSYCVVPFVRGKERSRKSSEIISEIKRLKDNGVTDILLLGQNVNSYGKDIGDITFAELLYKINEIDGIKRIRFMTSHPKDFDDSLIEAVHYLPKVEKRVHLPIQSGSDRILELMNRKYTLSQYIKLIEKIRLFNDDISVSTDILCGFPGETEEDHLATLKAMEEIRFDEAYMFAYSKRKNTAVYNLPDEPDEKTRKRRLKEVISLQQKITSLSLKKLIGIKTEFLVEDISARNKNEWFGRTKAGRIAILPDFQNIKPGLYILCKVESVKGNSLFLKKE